MAQITQGLLDILSGSRNSPYAGLLSPDVRANAQNQALLDASLTMLAGSRGLPGQGRPRTGELLARSFGQGRQSFNAAADAALRNQMVQQQIAAADRTQEMNARIGQIFANGEVTPQQLLQAAAIANSFGDFTTGNEFATQAEAMSPDPVERPPELAAFDEWLKGNPGKNYEDYLRFKATLDQTPPKPDRVPIGETENLLIRTTDPEGNPVYKPVPVGSTYEDLEGQDVVRRSVVEAEEEDREREELARIMRADMTRDFARASVLLSSGEVGGRWKTLIGWTANSPAYNEMKNLIDKLKGTFTLTALADAKARGITFGALSEQEMRTVADSVGALDITQDPAVTALQLAKIADVLESKGELNNNALPSGFMNLIREQRRKGGYVGDGGSGDVMKRYQLEPK
jgi:hypothetical protein